MKDAWSPSGATRLLDLTRLVSRVGGGPRTGIDRVEAAYLDRFLDDDAPAAGLVRHGRHYSLIGKDGLRALAARLNGLEPWGPAPWHRQFVARQPQWRDRALADIGRLRTSLVAARDLGRYLHAAFPDGATYFNVGHANFTEPLFRALESTPRIKAHFLIHDIIPIRQPEFQRPKTTQTFTHAIQRISQVASRMIFPSRASHGDTEDWLGGRIPPAPACVAPLGVVTAKPRVPADGGTPFGKRPFFVALGTIEPRKAHDLLLDIWEAQSAVAGDRALPPLVIIGRRGWMNEAVFARLDRLKRAGLPIHELADLDDRDVAWYLSNARALLQPSRAEGFGLPPIEALSFGTPVICRDLPVYRETLGSAPIYEPTDDPARWLKHMASLGPRRYPPMAPPTWDAHFNVVLNDL